MYGLSITSEPVQDEYILIIYPDVRVADGHLDASRLLMG